MIRQILTAFTLVALLGCCYTWGELEPLEDYEMEGPGFGSYNYVLGSVLPPSLEGLEGRLPDLFDSEVHEVGRVEKVLTTYDWKRRAINVTILLSIEKVTFENFRVKGADLPLGDLQINDLSSETHLIIRIR
ncbi:MAG: hypothetical protein KUG81_01875 [Gammaproteobacteria bacterium]|nr:hypothetical protein [Gammaproteobacteria bacterium]